MSPIDINAPRRHRVLQHESLEQRQVFAALIFNDRLSLHEQAPDANTILAEFAVSNVYRFNAPAAKDPELFTAQPSLDARLSQFAQEYWKGVLGMPIDQVQRDWWPVTEWLNDSDGRVSALSLATAAPVNTAGDITNSQHASIDEADSVELTSDGFLYTVSGTEIHVVDLRDPNHPVSKRVLQGDEGDQQRLFVAGNRLVVVGQKFRLEKVYGTEVQRSLTVTVIDVYDITDRLAPQWIGNTVVDGSNVVSRMQGDRLTLVQSNDFLLPAPQVAKDADGKATFESAEAYVSRHRANLLSSIMPDYRATKADGSASDAEDIGDWRDIAFASPRFARGTSIVRIDIGGPAPVLVGSEYLGGLSQPLVYVAPQDIYLVGSGMDSSDIYRVATQSDGQLAATAKVTVPGTISNSRWLDEFDGVLRVATLGIQWQPERVDRDPNTLMFDLAILRLPPPPKESANIYTIGVANGNWQILGRLEDIAPGQRLLSAHFEGSRAVVTTGEFVGLRPLLDPLHGIDLRDPSQPKELSELTIPGFTTFLQRIDANHWIGLGFEVVDGLAVMQVSLYEGNDLSSPRVLDRWTGSRVRAGVQLDALNVHYDAATGVLTLGEQANRWWDWTTQLAVNDTSVSFPVFKIDLSSDDPLQLLATLEHPEQLQRCFVMNDVLVAVSANAVRTYDLEELSGPPAGQSLLQTTKPEAIHISTMVPRGHRQTVRLLGGWGSDYFAITSVRSDKMKVSTGDDQRLIIAAPDQLDDAGSYSETITATVRFFDGQTSTIHVYVWVPFDDPSDPVVPAPVSSAKASLLTRLEDEDGNPVLTLDRDQEAWVVISVQDGREGGTGVFGAYVDVDFDTTNFQVVGRPEAQGIFKNGVRGDVSASGIRTLGGFSDDIDRQGSQAQDLVRFKIRALDDGPIQLTVRASESLTNETLLYDDLARLDPKNIAGSVLRSGAPTLSTVIPSLARQDVNDDGLVTALDALLVINYVNGQVDQALRSAGGLARVALSSTDLASQLATFDLTGDGIVSGIDVLHIINTINAGGSRTIEGESVQAAVAARADERPAASAVDQVWAVAPEPDMLRKGKNV